MNIKQISQANTKVRSSNIELYRIIVMLAIVAHHYVVSSALMPKMMSETNLTFNNLFFYVFGGWGKTGIDCFVLITGYFMCKSNITLHKFLKLVLAIVFYSVTITLVFLLSGYKKFEYTDLFALLPINHVDKNFTSCYLVFFLFIPFLNALISNISRSKHIWLIATSLFVYSFLPQLFFEVTFNYSIWFCILYLISSYIRLYPLKRDNDIKFWRNSFLISFSLGICGIIAVEAANVYILRPQFQTWLSPFGFVHDSNMPLSLTIAISLFMWVKNIHIPNSKIINTIAASCFGVLLIHTSSSTMINWLWKDVIDCAGHFDTPFFWLYAIVCVIGVFTICSFIEIVRIKTMENKIIECFEILILQIKEKITSRKKSMFLEK